MIDRYHDGFSFVPFDLLSRVLPAPEVAVVISTWNRPDQLERLLGSLAAQTLPRARFEVIVVDNGGGIDEVSHREGADVVLFEATPGTSRARNRGWRHAFADLVAFVDDDATVAPNWLEEALRFRSRRPEAAAFGGPIFPLWDAPRPGWFKEEYELRSWGNEERALGRGESLSGSNMFFPRKTLERLNGFDPELGPAGKRFMLGEETELFARLWADNPTSTILYSPDVIVRHSVPSRKMSVRYQLGRTALWGESYVLAQRLPPQQRLRTIASNGKILARELLRAAGTFHLPIQQWAVEDLQQAAERFGMIKGALRSR